MPALFFCRYSLVERSMKSASLLSASAAEPLFPYLSLLTRTDCGCQPSSPQSPQQPAEKTLELFPFPIAVSSAIATHAEQSKQPTLTLPEATTEHHSVELKTNQTN